MKPAFIAIGTGELCTRLKVPYRHVRYVMERGILPEGVEPSPDRGHHRLLDPAQAFWLGIVLKLKASGMRAPLAGKVATDVAQNLRAITQNLSWEYPFAPHRGWFQTEYQWFSDIGDLKYNRIATTANPSVDGLFEFPWAVIGKSGEVKGVAPVVIIRLDITRLSQMLSR